MELKEKYKLKKEQLISSVKDFEETLAIDLSGMNARLKDAVENGQIQKFEIVVELLWKTAKQYLFVEHGVDTKSPKQTIKELFLTGVISDEDYNLLLDMLDDRNRLSYIYQKKVFEEVKSKLPHYLNVSQNVQSVI